MNQTFALKDLGPLKKFLGIEVFRNSAGLHLTQRKYTADLLKKFGYENIKPTATPMATGRNISKFDGEIMNNPTLFRSAVGGLQYLGHTRADITYSVNKMSQFLQNPTNTHWIALKRIFRYLAGTLNHGLIIQRSENLNIVAFADADWASCPDDRRSTAGYCVYLGNNLVSWSSKKQHVVARSSTEAEYRSLAHCAAEITWIQALLEEINVSQNSSPKIWCDNLSAKSLASNPVYHARTKHIELDIHFIRDKVLNKDLEIDYVPTSDQTADLLTKPLSHSRFIFLKDKLGVVETHSSLREGIRSNNTSVRDQNDNF